MEPKLDFMLKISTLTHTIRRDFQPVVETFMENRTLSNVAFKSKINHTTACYFWEDRLFGINNGQKMNREAYDKLCAEIDVDSPHRSDKDFDREFNKWEKKPIEMQHLEQIKRSIDQMEFENEELIEEFKNALEEAKELGQILSEHLVAAKSLLRSILEMTDYTKILNTFEKAEPITNQITQKQSLFFRKIVHVKRTLRLYNKQRVAWVEDIMGVTLKKPSYMRRMFASMKKSFSRKTKNNNK